MAAEGTGSASCMNAESAEDGATGRVGFAVGYLVLVQRTARAGATGEQGKLWAL